MSLKESVKKLQTDIPVVFIALKKEETPVFAKIMAGLTIVYALSPIDFIPDFIPVLGYLDDLIILPLLVKLTIRLIPDEILENCRRESEDLWKDGKAKKWYYAVPMIAIWGVIIVVVIRAIMKVWR